MEPQVVYDTHGKHWTKWMGGNGIENFFDKYTIDWTPPQMLWPQFRDFLAHQNIPADLVQRIWEAIVLSARNCLGVREVIAEALNQPILLEDLGQAIKRAPGPSGLSYTIMKEWPDSALIKTHEAVAQIWEEKIILSCWNQKWLCPKPKVDPEEATLHDLQPLNLV